MALQLRHRHKRILSNPKPYFAHFLSTDTPNSDSADPPPSHPPDSQEKSPFSSYLNDVKSSLKNHPPPPKQRLPFSRPSGEDRNPRPKEASFDEIRKNLAEYRRRSDLPSSNGKISPPASTQPISFQELYNRNAMNRTPVDDSQGGSQSRMSFDAIRESLRTLKNSGRDAAATGRRDVQPMSLTALRNSLNSRNEGSGTVIGSGFNLTSSLFGKDVKEKESEDGEKSEEKKSELLRSYSHVELGERLKGLRPEKKAGFSLIEMNDRLVKLRELEEKQSMSRMALDKHRSLDDFRESLRKLKNVNEETSREKMNQRLSILNQIGPSAVQGPPKEQLVEKYFHPDNMSAAEKLKLELAAVRDEFKMSESDCGSARVQVAQLTTKIKYLSDSLHKKDKHSRKGLNEMVQLRKKLLKYLRRTDWDSYTMVLSKLGLRDNSEVKKNHQSS